MSSSVSGSYSIFALSSPDPEPLVSSSSEPCSRSLTCSPSDSPESRLWSGSTSSSMSRLKREFLMSSPDPDPFLSSSLTALSLSSLWSATSSLSCSASDSPESRLLSGSASSLKLCLRIAFSVPSPDPEPFSSSSWAAWSVSSLWSGTSSTCTSSLASTLLSSWPGCSFSMSLLSLSWLMSYCPSSALPAFGSELSSWNTASRLSVSLNDSSIGSCPEKSSSVEEHLRMTTGKMRRWRPNYFCVQNLN